MYGERTRHRERVSVDMFDVNAFGKTAGTRGDLNDLETLVLTFEVLRNSTTANSLMGAPFSTRTCIVVNSRQSTQKLQACNLPIYRRYVSLPLPAASLQKENLPRRQTRAGYCKTKEKRWINKKTTCVAELAGLYRDMCIIT